MTLQVPLKYGCAATVVIEESDRLTYIPPPVARGDHAATCGCLACALDRRMTKAK